MFALTACTAVATFLTSVKIESHAINPPKVNHILVKNSTLPLSQVVENTTANPKISLGFGGEPANAWIYDFIKDTFQPISNETVGRLFTQVWLTSYNANHLENKEGGAA